MNPILIDLGFITIHWYSIMILLGLFIGGSLIIRESKRFKISEDYIFNLIFLTIIFGIIGARLEYVIFEWDQYSNNLLGIIKIWEGGLAIHGGIITGLLCMIIYTKKYKVNTWNILDITVVGLIIGQAIGRWGNFFNSEAHGPATTLEFLQQLHLPKFIIEGMNIYGTYYQPTFLYESIWCLIGFIILLFFRRRYYCKIGQPVAFYFIWYGIGRFFIEGLRTDSLMLGDFRVAQLISIGLIITGIIIMVVKSRGSKLKNRYNDLENTNEIRF